MAKEDDWVELLVDLIRAAEERGGHGTLVEVLKIQGLCQKDALLTLEDTNKNFQDALKDFDNFCMDNVMFIP